MIGTVASLMLRHPDAGYFKFGDDPALCADLLGRVRTGQKVATVAALRDFDPSEAQAVEIAQVSYHY